MLSTREETQNLQFITYSPFVAKLFEAFASLNMPVYLNPVLAKEFPHPETQRSPRYVFVCNGINAKTLVSQGFTPIQHQTDQYTKNLYGVQIELHATTASKDWMLHYLLATQTFAHTAVLSDGDGTLYAPLPITIESHNTKMIYALHDAGQLFNDNIENLLDVIEFLANDYRVSDALYIAAEYWHPDSKTAEREATAALLQRIANLRNNERLHRHFLKCLTSLDNFFTHHTIKANGAFSLYQSKINVDDEMPITPELIRNVSPFL